MKGAFVSETAFILFLMIFIGVLVYFSTSITTTFPSATFLTAFDFALFGGEIITIAVACTVITGLACVAATIAAAVINFFIIPPAYQIIFAPLLAVLAYITARLARGGG